MRNTTFSNSRPLPEQVAEELKNYIIQKDLKSGDKLPAEKTLAKEMGVARGTIREAIRSLASQHVLQVRHGSGTFVAENIGISDDPLGLSFIRDKQKLTRDLLEVRSIIEPNIAELAALRATKEDIAELDRLYRLLEQQILNGEDYLETDLQFHQKIFESSGNLVIPHLAPIISQAVELFTKRTHYRLLQETLDTHRSLLEAIRDHDATLARDVMILHLAYNRNLLLEVERKELGLPPLAPKVPDNTRITCQ